jgi:predicted acyltransferase
LWTDSFTLFMAGLDCVIFAIFLWLVDGLGFKRAVKPLVIMGMNAITVYLASELLDEALNATHLHQWLFNHLFAWPASPFNASLLYAVAYVLVMYLLAWFMYRRNWFLRV